MFDIFFVSRHSSDRSLHARFCERFPSALLLRGQHNICEMISAARTRSLTSMYWLVTDDVVVPDHMDLTWKPETWDSHYPHAWSAVDHSGDRVSEFAGAYLIPRSYRPSAEELASGTLREVKHMDSLLLPIKPYDIVFTSRHGKNSRAFDNFAKRYPDARYLPNHTSIGSAAVAGKQISSTGMFWLITDDVLLPDDLHLGWRPPVWDRIYTHVWPTQPILDPQSQGSSGVYLIPSDCETDFLVQCKHVPGPVCSAMPYDRIMSLSTASDPSDTVVHDNDLFNACVKAKELAVTEMHWLALGDIDILPDFDLSWRPAEWDRSYVHKWPTIGIDGQITHEEEGVYLIPGNYVPRSSRSGSYVNHSKHMEQPAAVQLSFDIFFISYDESYADENWQDLVQRFPRAKRMHGIKGIHNAHRRCAEQARTSMFYTVDADTVPNHSWDFSFRPSRHDRDYLHVWYSQNPVNGLSYGWGSIKLWPKMSVLEFDRNWLDFTTTVGNIKVIPETIAETRYNRDQISTWRSAFRESVKLCHNVGHGETGESLDRLLVWLNANSNADWADRSRQGAADGLRFYQESRASSETQLTLINDFDWLSDRFNNQMEALSNFDRNDLLGMLGADRDV
jgi:hypothetical protein